MSPRRRIESSTADASAATTGTKRSMTAMGTVSARGTRAALSAAVMVPGVAVRNRCCPTP